MCSGRTRKSTTVAVFTYSHSTTVSDQPARALAFVCTFQKETSQDSDGGWGRERERKGRRGGEDRGEERGVGSDRVTIKHRHARMLLAYADSNITGYERHL